MTLIKRERKREREKKKREKESEKYVRNCLWKDSWVAIFIHADGFIVNLIKWKGETNSILSCTFCIYWYILFITATYCPTALITMTSQYNSFVLHFRERLYKLVCRLPSFLDPHHNVTTTSASSRLDFHFLRVLKSSISK